MENRWAIIVPHLRAFEQYLSPQLPPLDILSANDRQWTLDQYRLQNESGIFKRYGVYLIFSPREELEYVGVAMNSFDDRIWSHDEYIARRWTDVIPFCYDHYFLALALEFFLICRLRPRGNKTYRAYDIPNPCTAGPKSQ